MSHEFPLLRDLIVILGSSVVVCIVSNRFRVPLIISFMLTGTLIGPYGFGLIHDRHDVEQLAEIGVVLLLFTIGLEFSIRGLIRMKRSVFGAGGLQVGGTILLVAGLAALVGETFSHAVFLGFLCALSSTALVMKTYADRAETDTPFGRVAIGILLFQDLCVVPMMLLVPILSGREGASAANLAVKLGTAAAAVVGTGLAAHWLVPRALTLIVRLRSREVFVGFAVLVCFGTAWLTSQVGLSLALGAFIAGIVLSESEYSHQIVADILPFRDVFNSVFFISVGMLLSVPAALHDAPMVGGLLAAVVIGKCLIIVPVVMALGGSFRVAATAALGLAQIGEFSFILSKVGVEQGLLGQAEYQRFLAVSVVSMMLTPVIIQVAPRITGFFQSRFGRPGRPDPVEDAPRPLDNHVVIAGYGLNGRNLSRVLGRAHIPYRILELNPDAVEEAREKGEPVMYGDCVQREVLLSVGIARAKVFVVAISDPTASRRTVAVARELNPDLTIVVRTRFMQEVPDLFTLGANQVIPEEFETSIEIFSRVLAEFGIAGETVRREVATIRREGYQLLRAPESVLDDSDEVAEILSAATTRTLRLPAAPIEKTIGALHIRKRSGATIIAVVRNGMRELNPGPEFRLQGGDMLVLLGRSDEIAAAERLLANDDRATPGPSFVG